MVVAYDDEVAAARKVTAAGEIGFDFHPADARVLAGEEILDTVQVTDIVLDGILGKNALTDVLLEAVGEVNLHAEVFGPDRRRVHEIVPTGHISIILDEVSPALEKRDGANDCDEERNEGLHTRSDCAPEDCTEESEKQENIYQVFHIIVD